MATMTAFEVQAVLDLITDAFDQKLNESEKKTESFGTNVKKGIGTAAKAVGTALVAATGAVVKFGADSVQTGKEFDQSMSQVYATMGDKADAMLDTGQTASEALRDFAQEMGRTTQYTASQSADALNYMALAGYDAQTSMDMLPNVMALASAGAFDLARASDMVTDTQTAFGISIERTGQMVDEMAKAASTGNTSVEQLGDAFLVVGGLAKELNGGMVQLSDGTSASVDGIQEMEIVLTAMANAGIKGSEAGTHLRNMIMKLSSPTAEGVKQMEALGVSVFDSEGRMRSMKDIMGDLNGALGNLTQQQKIQAIAELFNARDLASAEALLGAVGQDWDKIGESILDARGAAKKMQDVQLDNLAGDITIFQSALDGAKIAISDGLTPVLREFVQFGTDGITKLTSAFKSKGLQGAAEALGNIVSKGVSKIMQKMPMLLKAGKSLVTTLTKGISNALPSMMRMAPDVLETFMDLIFDTVDSILDALPKIVDTLASALPKLITTFTEKILQNIPRIVSGLISVVSAIVGKLPEIVSSLVKEIPNIILMLMNAVADTLPQIIRGLDGIIEEIVQSLPQILSSLVLAIPSVIASLFEGIGSILTNTFFALFGGAGAEALDQYMRENHEIVSAMQELTESYNQIVEARDNSIAQADAESQYNSDLLGELKSITDANGNVKKGYEERAEFIIGQLKDAYGIEAEIINGAVSNYRELISNVETLIEKEHAEAVLAAEKQAYIEAIKLQKGATDDLVQAEANLERGYQALDVAMDDYQLSSEATIGMSREEYEANKKKELGITQLESAYDEANKTYKNVLRDISQYETDYARLNEGNYKDIGNTLREYRDNSKATLDTHIRDLRQQIKDDEFELKRWNEIYKNEGDVNAKNHADTLQQTINDNKSYLTELVRSARDFNSEINSELDSNISTMSSKGESGGKAYGDGIVSGLYSREDSVRTAAANLAWVASHAYNASLEIKSPSRVMKRAGINTVLGIVEGIKSSEREVANAINGIADGMDSTFNSVQLSVDANSNRNIQSTDQWYWAVQALKEALSEMRIELDGDEMGVFVDQTVSKLVYLHA